MKHINVLNDITRVKLKGGTSLSPVTGSPQVTSLTRDQVHDSDSKLTY